MTKRESKSMGHLLEHNWTAVSYIFLGVGLLMFLLNITAMLSYLPERYSMIAFNISTFGSIILIIYVVHELTEKNRK